MSAYTTINLKLDNTTDAMNAAEIMKDVASVFDGDCGSQIEAFISCIRRENNEVNVNGFSLLSNTFRELIPQIMSELSKHNLGAITLTADFCSYSCGYEAFFDGRISKTGKLKMSFEEHD